MVVLQDREVVVVVRLNNQILLSVIIPVLNEGRGIEVFLAALPFVEDSTIEYIFVDGGSTDETLTKLGLYVAQSRYRKLITCTNGRAVQMNAGAALAKGRVLAFLHADTLLPADFIHSLVRYRDQENSWGRFDVSLNNSRVSYKVISWFINTRSRITGIATGDQCMFVHTALFSGVSGFTELPLMEDIDLSKKLKAISKPVCLSSRVVTSARKWEKEGLIKTILLMWQLRLLFALGSNPDKLVKRYYS